MRTLFVASGGGHLDQLAPLLAMWPTPWHLATFDSVDTRDKVVNFTSVYQPTNRNLFNLFRNLLLAAVVIGRYRPEVIISSGAGPAVPFFVVGRLFRVKTVYIEPVDRIDMPTLTARLIVPFTSLFVVQHAGQLATFPRRCEVTSSL